MPISVTYVTKEHFFFVEGAFGNLALWSSSVGYRGDRRGVERCGRG